MIRDFITAQGHVIVSVSLGVENSPAEPANQSCGSSPHPLGIGWGLGVGNQQPGELRYREKSCIRPKRSYGFYNILLQRDSQFCNKSWP